MFCRRDFYGKFHPSALMVRCPKSPQIKHFFETYRSILDIDSTVFGRFTDEDEQGLRQLVAQLEKVLATTDYKKFFASVAG